MQRLPMRKIREALRLKAAGLTQREIAASLGVGRTTVGEYLDRAAPAGLIWPLPDEMDDPALKRRLFASAGGDQGQARPQPDCQHIHGELRRKSVTLRLLWDEYRAVRGLASAGRHRTHPDLSGITVGEQLQRALQRDAAPRGAQRRVVRDDETGPGRHRHVAQAAQPTPPASCPRNACASAGNDIRENRRSVAQTEGARHLAKSKAAGDQAFLGQIGETLSTYSQLTMIWKRLEFHGSLLSESYRPSWALDKFRQL